MRPFNKAVLLVNVMGRDLPVRSGELGSVLPSSVEEQADDARDLNHLENEMRMA